MSRSQSQGRAKTLDGMGVSIAIISKSMLASGVSWRSDKSVLARSLRRIIIMGDSKSDLPRIENSERWPSLAATGWPCN